VAAQEDLKRAWSDAASRAEQGLSALRAEHERFAASQNEALQSAEERERNLQAEVCLCYGCAIVSDFCKNLVSCADACVIFGII
jgi:DNA repair exonuclease SbcCD ATPase subunit